MTNVLETTEAKNELGRLAQKYSWDIRIEEAMEWPERLLRRVMDIGTLDDMISMEKAIGKETLKLALSSSEAGALRPQSWVFWHHRLGLVEANGRCPSYPIRRFT